MVEIFHIISVLSFHALHIIQTFIPHFEYTYEAMLKSNVWQCFMFYAGVGVCNGIKSQSVTS